MAVFFQVPCKKWLVQCTLQYICPLDKSLTRYQKHTAMFKWSPCNSWIYESWAYNSWTDAQVKIQKTLAHPYFCLIKCIFCSESAIIVNRNSKWVGEAAKKNSFLSGPAIPYIKKVLFTLVAHPFGPSPLLVARPLKKNFFAASPSRFWKNANLCNKS